MADPGEGPGGPAPPPLLFNLNKAQRAEKNFLGDQPPPLPFSQGLDDRLPLSECLDPPLLILTNVNQVPFSLGKKNLDKQGFLASFNGRLIY